MKCAWRSYKPTILLSLLYFIGELSNILPWPQEEQNWIIAKPVYMSVAWNVKYASGQLQWILAALMFLYYVKTPNKVNRTSMTIFLLWVIFDTICYFYNYKSWGYSAMYAWLPVAWVCVYYSKMAERLWRPSKQ